MRVFCAICTLSHCIELQSVYKTYIDVVHIQKDEASNLFSMFAAEESQMQATAQELLSQTVQQRNLADAPNTQVGRWDRGGHKGECILGTFAKGRPLNMRHPRFFFARSAGCRHLAAH